MRFYSVSVRNVAAAGDQPRSERFGRHAPERSARVNNLCAIHLHFVLTHFAVFHCMMAMRKKTFFVLGLATLLTFTAGCVRTLDNRREAGNPLVKDKVVRVYERPVMQCWTAAKDVLTINGTIVNEDVMQSTVSARVDTRTVRIKTEAVDPKMTRITTQVRTKMGNSDLDLAGEIDKQIALRLAAGATSATGPTASK